MKRGLLVVVLGAMLSGGAAAKAPPSGIQLCGTNGCATIAQADAEGIFIGSNGGATPPARPAPFYLLRWTWEDGQPASAGYWLPDANLVRLGGGGWGMPDPAVTGVLAKAAAGLEPLAVPALTQVVVGRRLAANPASYAVLLGAGTRVSTWAGARDWIRIKLAAAEPSPWTDGSFDLRISKASGFVWRDGAVYRIPQPLAQLVRLGRSLVTAPPRGFGALGTAGCLPPSPRNATGKGFSSQEAFGTATARQLWALFFLPAGTSWASRDSATFDGLAGKEVKIVFRFTASVFQPVAIGPDGTSVKPAWGPTPHLGSNWNRPGNEWGAGFVFPEPGCWQIHTGSGGTAGDVWLLVRS